MTLNLKNWSENLKYKPLQPFSNPNNTQSAQSLSPNSKIQTLKQSYNIYWLERQKPYQYQLYEYKNEEIKWKLWKNQFLSFFDPNQGKILTQNSQIWGFLYKIVFFHLIRKTGTILNPIATLTLKIWSETLGNNQFQICLTQIRPKFWPKISKYLFLIIFNW